MGILASLFYYWVTLHKTVCSVPIRGFFWLCNYFRTSCYPVIFNLIKLKCIENCHILSSWILFFYWLTSLHKFSPFSFTPSNSVCPSDTITFLWVIWLKKKKVFPPGDTFTCRTRLTTSAKFNHVYVRIIPISISLTANVLNEMKTVYMYICVLPHGNISFQDFILVTRHNVWRK